MTKLKKIIAFVLSLVVFCSLCVMFASCSVDETIEQMQQQIEDLQALLNTQQDTIDELKKEKNNLVSMIDELKKRDEELANLIEQLNRNLYFAVENEDLVTARDQSIAQSSDIGPSLWLTSLDKSLIVEWTCYKSAGLYSRDHERSKILILDGEQEVYFKGIGEAGEYVSVIVYDCKNIVGYAVLRMTLVDERLSNLETYTEVLASYEFPKINSQFQFIPEAYVKRQISNYISLEGVNTND